MASPATTSATPAPTPVPASTPTLSQVGSSSTSTNDMLPSSTALIQAARLAMSQDKQIALDYFIDTHNTKAFIAEDPETKDKVLVKSRDEYTSLVSKMYKVGDEFLIITENTIYIVSGKIQKRKFPHTMFQRSDEQE